nr:immunoglobulin heavy chain junction region [Mus musculus]NSM03927.1 immunoglobulin heavy chain junction region [Mus musculus]NSM04000.1 immunoglobulin heavy chain junction region [Mus musculus]NSM04961.1 immunoglobulin heavy chain junction region [Mus musculus]NSM05396.1 immunoglobulin heavy chain junction region [Mus musculus]
CARQGYYAMDYW